MFSSRNKKINEYPCTPQFYYIKEGFKGVKIIQACFCDDYTAKYTESKFWSDCADILMIWITTAYMIYYEHCCK